MALLCSTIFCASSPSAHSSTFPPSSSKEVSLMASGYNLIIFDAVYSIARAFGARATAALAVDDALRGSGRGAQNRPGLYACPVRRPCS